jgi:hypothetical protein
MTLLCKKKTIFDKPKNLKTESSNLGCFASESDDSDNAPKSIVLYTYGADAVGNNSGGKMFCLNCTTLLDNGDHDISGGSSQQYCGLYDTTITAFKWPCIDLSSTLLICIVGIAHVDSSSLYSTAASSVLISVIILVGVFRCAHQQWLLSIGVKK